MSQRKKIIIIGPGYPYRNGQSVYLAHLCEKLSDEFTIELLNYTLLYPDFLFPGSTQYDESKDESIIFPNKRMLSSMNPLSWRRTARYIRQQNPDIIAIDWWHPFFGPCIFGLTSLLSAKMKKRLVFITENVISHEANLVDKVLTRLGMKHSKTFLALSDTVEHQLMELFQNPVIFKSALPIYDFYNKQDQEGRHSEELKASFGFEPYNKVLLFFGLVRKYKGLDILLHAFNELIRHRQDVRLLIAGEFYEDDQPYREIISEHKLEKYIHIENRYIPDGDVGLYFNACDAVAMPYRSATQSGIMSMAYAFRKPVVVTDVGELRKWVDAGKTGLVLPPGDSHELADSLFEILGMIDEGYDFPAAIQSFLSEKDTFGQVNTVFYDILKFIEKKK